MRVFFALVAFVTLAAAHHGGAHENFMPEVFEDGKEYDFAYRSLVATGLPRQNKQVAGLEKNAVLTVQVEKREGFRVLGLKLRHVNTGSFDKQVEDFTRPVGISHTPEKTIEGYGPVFVYLREDNHFQKIETPQQMPEEVINVYRAIANLITVRGPTADKHEKLDGEEPVVYTRYEQGLNGHCKTTYDILNNGYGYHGHQELNFTKTINHMQCYHEDEGRFVFSGHDSRGCEDVCPNHVPETIEGNMQPEMGNWKRTEGCPTDFHPKNDLVESYTTYNYNMTKEQAHGGQGEFVKVHQAQALDKKVLPLRKQQITTVSLVQLRLAGERQVQGDWRQGLKGETKKYETLVYRFPEEHYQNELDAEYLTLYGKVERKEIVRQVETMIKSLAKIIVSDNIELKGRTGDQIVQLTMAMGVLNKEHFTQLWGKFGHHETEQQQVERQVFVDVTALTGTNQAAEFLIEQIKGKKFTTLETVAALEYLQTSLIKPTKTVLDLIGHVCTGYEQEENRFIFSTACITLGHLVGTHCETTTHTTGKQVHMNQMSEQYEIQGEQYLCKTEQYVGLIKERLHQATKFHQQTVYIQTLARFSHPEAIKTLIPYVYGEPTVVAQYEKMTERDHREDISEYVDFMRQVTIYALHHTAKEHAGAIQPIVQGIYFNQEEQYELRIAALSVLIASQPTEATLGRIVLELPQEENKQVASYAYSALRSLVNTTIPCMQQTARRVRNILGAIPDVTFGAQYSKWYAFTKYEHLINLGLKGQFEWTHSNVSAIPRAIYGGLTSNKGPYVSTVGDFGMIVKGLENFGKTFFHPEQGMDKIVEQVMTRVRRSARNFQGEESVEQMLEEIERNMQFNVDEIREEPRGVIYGSILGNNGFLPIDKEFVRKTGTKVAETVFKLLREGETKTYRFVRILMPRTYIHAAPAVNGLPVIMSNRHPIVVTLSIKDLNTRFAQKEKTLEGFVGIAASALIQPTVYHTSIHSVLTINPFGEQRMAYGVRATEQTHITLPLDVAVQYTHQTKTFGLTIRPRFEKVFYHKTKAVTFKTPALLIREPGQPILEHQTAIKTQDKPFRFERTFFEKLGFGLRAEGISFNEDYAVNFMRNRLARKNNIFISILKQLNNEWFTGRQWSVRVERNEEKPVDEIKMIFRLGNLIKQRVAEEEGRKEVKEEKVLSEKQLVEEQRYPENLRMISYGQEYKNATGRHHETRTGKQQLENALERIVKKTEKYWNQVDRQLGEQLTKETTQVRAVEYMVLTKGEKQTVVVEGHLVLAAPLSKQARFMEIVMDVQDRPISFVMHAVHASTPGKQHFNIEKLEHEPKKEQRAVIGAIVELETRETGKQQYAIKIDMEQSEEKQKMFQDKKMMEEVWYMRQCMEDIKENKKEMSTACTKASKDLLTLNKIHFEIELPEENHPILKNATHKLREYLKVALYRNLRANYNHEKVNPKKIEGELIFSEEPYQTGMANLTIITPDNEYLHFERLSLPKALQPNTKWSLMQTMKSYIRNDRPEPECVFNGDYIRTFNNVTVSMEEMKEGEKYILARDNDEEPKFIVIGEHKETQHKTELDIVLRNITHLRFIPVTTGKTYKVQINSTEVEVTPQKAHALQYGPHWRNTLTLHVEPTTEGHVLVLKVRDQGLRIIYDGENVKIQMTNRMFKGQLTGLCGNMNGETEEEFLGPRGCHYEREEDFVRSYALNQEHDKEVEGEWVCPEGVQPRGASHQKIQMQRGRKEQLLAQGEQYRQQMNQHHGQQHGHQGMVKRTMLQEKDGRICFSLEPVNTCEHGFEGQQVEMKQLPFVCLSKDQPEAIQLQRQIQASQHVDIGSHTSNVHAKLRMGVPQAKWCQKMH